MKVGRIVLNGKVVTAVDLAAGWIPTSELGLPDMGVVDLLTHHDDVVDGRMRAAERGAEPLREEDVTWVAPVESTRTILAMGLNYRDHVREIGAPMPEQPLLFGKLPGSITDPYADIVIDERLSSQIDHEVELTVILGRRVRDVAPDTAADAIAGFAVANDVSARDLQFTEGQWIRSKSFDGFCPIGPWITTPDELGDPYSLAITCSVNGEERQKSNTRELIFKVPELISFLSTGTTLEPGDVILTGTPSGVAMGRPDRPWVKPGDVVRCEIESLGAIENRFVAAR